MINYSLKREKFVKKLRKKKKLIVIRFNEAWTFRLVHELN